MHRGVIWSKTRPNRTGPTWTEDQIRAEARTEDRTGLRPVLDRIGPDWIGPILDHSKAEKWHRLPVPPLFCGARSGRVEGHGHATLFIRSTLFSVGHDQPVSRGTTVPPILFGPPVQTGTGPKTEKEKSLD